MADENTPIRGSARSTQRIGLVVAVSVALVGTGILGLLATRGGGPAPGGSAKGGKGPTPAPPAPVVPPPVDITQTGLAEVGKARVQYVDRRNPGRVAGLIQWSKIDPLPNGRALVERPQGVIFLADGRQLVFNAATGRLFTRPGATEPESGLFEGGVPVALYAARTDGRPIDTATDRPVAMFFAQTISFDLGLGELSTPDEFRASGPTFDFKGRGLRLVFDQVAERIALLSVEKTDFLRYATDTDASSASAPAGGTAAKPATSPTNPVDPAPPTLTGPSTVYAAAIDRAVTVRQGQRTLVGASLAGLLRINAAQQQQGTERVAATGLPASPPPRPPAHPPRSRVSPPSPLPPAAHRLPPPSPAPSPRAWTSRWPPSASRTCWSPSPGRSSFAPPSRRPPTGCPMTRTCWSRCGAAPLPPPMRPAASPFATRHSACRARPTNSASRARPGPCRWWPPPVIPCC